MTPARRLLVLPVVVALFATASCSSLAVAAATVNGQKITESEVESELDTLRDDPIFGEALRRDPDTRGQRRREILNELIYQQVAEQEARRLRITVNTKQADTLIDQTARSNGMSREKFIESQNLTLDGARKIAGRFVRRFALIEKVVRIVDVNDRAVRDVYEGQRDRFVEVHLERITVASQKDALAIIRELSGGADFADLAREKSTDSLAKSGGDMAPAPLTSLDVQVQGAISRAVEGGLSDPIQTANGSYEIYRLVERKTKSFREVSAEIRRALTQDERDQRYEAWLGTKVRAARIVVNPKYGRIDRKAQQPVVVPSTGELAP